MKMLKKINFLHETPFISKKAKHKKKSLLGFSEVMTENESTWKIILKSEGVSFEWRQPGIFSTTTHVPIYIIYFCNARVEDCDGS